jgi:hypothetical protein
MFQMSHIFAERRIRPATKGLSQARATICASRASWACESDRDTRGRIARAGAPRARRASPHRGLTRRNLRVKKLGAPKTACQRSGERRTPQWWQWRRKRRNCRDEGVALARNEMVW